MKKVYLLLGVIVVAIVVVSVYLFGSSFRNANYMNDYAKHLASAVQKGTLRAEYEGETHQLTDAHVDGVLRVLTRGKSELKSVRGAPKTYDGKITLYADELTLTMYRPDKKVDSVVMERVVGNSRAYYQLDDYAMFKWFLDATGFQEKAI